jgi:hypothetical protein
MVKLPFGILNGTLYYFSLREEHRLRFFENYMLRKLFWPKKDEVTGKWRSISDEELYFLYFSQNIVRVIKSRRMGLAGRVGDRRGTRRILLGRREG